MTNQPEQVYEVGAVVNGHRWSGTEWVPVPPPRKSRWAWWVFGGLGLALVLAAVFAAIAGPNRGSGESDDPERAAWFECKVAVLDLLKSPGSAEFPWFDSSYVTRSGDGYLIRATLEAQNSFGAVVVTDWTCTATPVGSGWRVTDVAVAN